MKTLMDEVSFEEGGAVVRMRKNSNSVQDYSQFAPLPADLTYRQAIDLLRATPATPPQTAK